MLFASKFSGYYSCLCLVTFLSLASVGEASVIFRSVERGSSAVIDPMKGDLIAVDENGNILEVIPGPGALGIGYAYPVSGSSSDTFSYEGSDITLGSTLKVNGAEGIGRSDLEYASAVITGSNLFVDAAGVSAPATAEATVEVRLQFNLTQEMNFDLLGSYDADLFNNDAATTSSWILLEKIDSVTSDRTTESRLDLTSGLGAVALSDSGILEAGSYRFRAKLSYDDAKSDSISMDSFSLALSPVAIPEPSSTLLSILGGCVLLTRRRK